jgi:carboxypeptidase C (cathepsin A)
VNTKAFPSSLSLSVGRGILCALLCLVAVPLRATTPPGADDEPVVTNHDIKLDGKTFSYVARAGFLSLRDPENRVRGRIFYTSYVVEQPAFSPPRPVVFVWNGGPGSNAGLLELGALGPLRLRRKDDPAAAADSASGLVDNQQTWLQFADLVFMDPIHTGYSYAATPEDEKEFLSDRGDAEAAAEFIRLYRVHYQVEKAPVFLMGESYGTFRAAGVAEILAKRNLPLNGIMMLSTIFDFETEPDFSDMFILPNYTAAAFAHHRLAPDLEKDLTATVNESQRFAQSDYVDALIQGDQLSDERKKAVAEKLARFTGVSADLWIKNDLRIGIDLFATMVLDQDKSQYVGHYDTRVVGTMASPHAPYDVNTDPSLNNGIDAAIVPYLRDNLHWKSDALYAGPFGGRWPTPLSPRGDWTSVLWDRGAGTADRAKSLAEALRHYPNLHIIIANGYYDFSTPFFASEYAISHLQLAPSARSRIGIVRYAGGHAAYMDPRVREQMFEDARTLVTKSETPANQ